jgi:pimeloyl-ACP methyl ester carboxylesterase
MRDDKGTPERRYVPVGAWAVHTRAFGSAAAPPVVLVHGLVISSRYMVPTAERLAGDFRVLAPDLPGFGRSSKPARALDVPALADALLAWMDALALPEAVLVGNSLGSQVVVDLAVRHPARVPCMVLSGPTIDPYARSAAVQVARLLLVDAPQERLSLIPLHLRDTFRAGLPRAWATLRHALEDRVEAKLPQVQAPTLVVRGERDPVVSPRWAEEAAALLPFGRLAVIPGAPHAVNYSAPDAFARLVRGFVGAGAT